MLYITCQIPNKVRKNTTPHNHRGARGTANIRGYYISFRRGVPHKGGGTFDKGGYPGGRKLWYLQI